MKNTKVYFETFGCQMNIADTELAVSSLLKAGYSVSGSAQNADVIILNTCSVRAKAERKVFHRINELHHGRRENPPLFGVMGCVAQLEGSQIFEQNSLIKVVVGTRATDRLPELIGRAEAGESRVTDLGERSGAGLWDVSLPARNSRSRAFIPIIEGCNKFCTYCIVPYSRGREKSRAATEIIGEMMRLKEEGYKEVQLIGQNVNSYRPESDNGLEGFKGATPFSRLLRAAAQTGMSRIKFTTSFPRDFHPDIISAIEENENLCNWIHLPVQSGNDRVLRAMRRGYKISEYLERVKAIKSSRRRMALTSDIIIGFPTETEEEFNDTVRLVEACRFDGLYIFKYSEREGTPAAKLSDDVLPAVKKSRFLKLEELQMGIQSEINDCYVGRELEVLVEGFSGKSAADLTGHTTCNKVVNFTGGEDLIGDFATVRITQAKNHSLYGELVGTVMS